MCKNKHILVTTFGDGNYGTYIQGFALCRALENMGFKVSILTNYPKLSLKHMLTIVLKKLCLLDWYLKYIKRYEITKQSQLIQQFKKHHLNLIELYYPYQLKHIASSYDLFITGSDQIWNTFNHFEPNYFLSFVKRKKKIAYSSSIGTASINPLYEDKVKEYLSDFSDIAVREETGAKLLSQLLNRKIYTVVDPVFLLSKGDWENFAAESEIDPPNNYCLCYCIADNKKYVKQIRQITSELHLTNTTYIPSMEHPTFWESHYATNIAKDIGPLEFVRLFLNAAYICTDSFHATALAIIFNKPFTVLKRFNDIDKKSQNSRIYDLLNRYKLSDRLYDETNNSFVADTISYAEINSIVDNDIKFSQQYLSAAIEL